MFLSDDNSVKNENNSKIHQSLKRSREWSLFSDEEDITTKKKSNL